MSRVKAPPGEEGIRACASKSMPSPGHRGYQKGRDKLQPIIWPNFFSIEFLQSILCNNSARVDHSCVILNEHEIVDRIFLSFYTFAFESQ